MSKCNPFILLLEGANLPAGDVMAAEEMSLVYFKGDVHHLL